MEKSGTGFSFLSAVICLLLATPLYIGTQAGAAGESRSNLDYADWLNQHGLPDFAAIVIKQVESSGAGAVGTGWRLKALKLQALAASGRFDEMKAFIAKEPNQESQDTWALKLSLAEAYYVWGKYSESQAIYDGFFKRYQTPPAGMKEFFIDSAYKYAQMLQMVNKHKAAVAAYESILKALDPKSADDKDIMRQMMCEQGELMLKVAELDPKERGTMVPAVKKICEKILWEQDLWFGKAIVLLAHCRMIDGDVDGAQKLIEDYRGKLEQIDKMLKDMQERTKDPVTRYSPMAECRYLLGIMMQTEAEKLMAKNGDKEKIVSLLVGKKLDAGGRRGMGAYQNFLTVFLDYSTSRWAPDAGVRVNKLEELLKKKYGADIKKDIPPDKMEGIRRALFQQARTMYNQAQYANAAEAYISVLNLFPESEASVVALGDLAQCYIELKDEILTDMTVKYLAERFGQDPELMIRAGESVVRLAELFANAPKKRDEYYNSFFRHFTKHPRTAGTLMRFGNMKLAAKEYETALGYYTQIQHKFKSTPLYAESLSRMAMCHSGMSNTTAEVESLNEYMAELNKREKPGAALVSANFRLAQAYRQMGDKFTDEAIKRFIELRNLLSDENNKLANSTEEREMNGKILESTLLNLGLIYYAMNKPEDKIHEYRKSSMVYLKDLVSKYPGSPYTPQALSRLGALHMSFTNHVEANKCFDKIQKEHPNAPEAKNMAYLRARAFLEMGQRDAAIAAFKDMFTDKVGKFSETQIFKAGSELFNVKEYGIALDAFDRITSSGTTNNALREHATMGKGKALVELGKVVEGLQVIEDMLKKNPRSGFTIEGYMYASRAYAETAAKERDAKKRMELFNKSVMCMREARRYEKTLAGKARLTLQWAKVCMLKAQSEEQFGIKEKKRQYLAEAAVAYLAIMCSDMADKELQPLIEDAYKECIPILIEIERWDDIMVECNRFIEGLPTSKMINQVRSWKNSASSRMATQGGGQPSETGKEEETAPAPAAAGADAGKGEAEKVEKKEEARAPQPEAGGDKK